MFMGSSQKVLDLIVKRAAVGLSSPEGGDLFASL